MAAIGTPSAPKLRTLCSGTLDAGAAAGLEDKGVPPKSLLDALWRS
jgi:hypothetical protein